MRCRPGCTRPAELDGAGRWTRFTKLTWPLIWPITALVLILQLILQVRVFDQVYLLASSTLSRSTMVLVRYIYTIAFQHNQARYASTIAQAMMAALPVVIFYLMFQRRVTEAVTMSAGIKQ